MIRSRSVPLATVLLLALASAGCFALARETYTTLRGAGVEPLRAADRVPVSHGRTGSALSQDPSLVRVATGEKALEVAVCDWDEGTWFVVFPPLPVPLLSLDEPLGLPGTRVVRVTFEGQGTWRAEFARLALTGPGGARVEPMRYKLVTRELDRSREPCSREREPRTKVDRAEVAIFGDAELWLTFLDASFPEGERALELDGITLDGVNVVVPKLVFEPGSRWFWYRVFP